MTSVLAGRQEANPAMRRITSIAISILLASAAMAVRTPGGEHPWNNKRIYYVVEYQGRLRARGYFVRRSGSWQRAPCVITEEEKSSFTDGDAISPSRLVRIRTVVTPSGEAIQRHEEVIIGDPGREMVSLSGGTAAFDASGSLGHTTRLPAPTGVLFEISGEWLASRQLRPGASFQANIIDRPARAISAETVDILEQLAPASGTVPSVWLAEFNSPGRPPMRARFTSDGRLTRLESEGLVYQVVSREEYESGRIAPENAATSARYQDQTVQYPVILGSPAISIGESVPAWDSFAWLSLRAGPVDRWYNAIPSSEYSQIDYHGLETNITAFRYAPRVDAAAVFPMRVPPDIQPFLSAHDAIPVLDPVIIETAYLAVNDADSRQEPNVLRAVSYLAGWINQNIATLPWTGVGSS
ncbi:MAG: hypothetical protein FWG74_05130, partial [Planctomycetes bacterium]|nr:hypothetical protein [Planctomycetota bacterium]